MKVVIVRIVIAYIFEGRVMKIADVLEELDVYCAELEIYRV